MLGGNVTWIFQPKVTEVLKDQLDYQGCNSNTGGVSTAPDQLSFAWLR